MSRKTNPKYCLHKPSNNGIVTLNGQRIYLGPYDDPATGEKYHRLVAEWLANGRRLPVDASNYTVSELCLEFWKHAQSYYLRPDGTHTSTLTHVTRSIRMFRKYYGSIPVAQLGPKAIRALQQDWIEQDLSRKTVNDYVAMVKQIIKWGVSRELVPANVFQGITTVGGLKKGRSKARETEPITPVLESHIGVVRPHVSSQVWALIQLQLLCGARSGELIKLRSIDIDTKGSVWMATIQEHKTSYRDRKRVLYFGGKAQAILRVFMGNRGISDYLFSPQEAEAERYRLADQHRRPNQKPNRKKSGRKVGKHYTTASYRRAISRACEKAGVPAWTPHQLRHNAATSIRREYGLEAAQVILGHATADITQVYAEVDHQKAIRVIGKIG